ncbi:MAG: ABC transporter ATP-binding protein [Alphaproteobacteria bacterium]|nr:ABC transporter ATP-binding protein [Alphaproteobacteria bacterium]
MTGQVTVPLLDVRSLRKWYDIRGGVIPHLKGHVQAVTDVSFEIARNEVLGLAGESGSGKTTIGRCVLRLIEPTAGEVKFDGEDVLGFAPERLRRFRRDAQIIFQDPFSSLDPRMTVGEIVAEPLEVQKLCANAPERRDRVVELLDTVSLSAEYLDRYPRALSGGQRQRVGIARALAVNPKFIVADEPVSSLDVSIQAQVVNLLVDLRAKFGLAILFISHDIAVMEHLSDRIAVIYLGRIMEVGPAEALCRDPKHPYTEALLSAVPDPDPAYRRQRIVLDGDVPNPVNPPSGCVFRTRCPRAIADCAHMVPPLREVASGRQAACIRL